MKTSTINYVVCSILLGIGFVLLISDEMSTIILAVLWFGLLWLSGRTKYGKKAWRKFWITNMKINRYFGVD